MSESSVRGRVHLRKILILNSYGMFCVALAWATGLIVLFPAIGVVAAIGVSIWSAASALGWHQAQLAEVRRQVLAGAILAAIGAIIAAIFVGVAWRDDGPIRFSWVLLVVLGTSMWSLVCTWMPWLRAMRVSVDNDS